jgi:hypothetical protein
LNPAEFIKAKVKTVDDLRALLLFQANPDIEMDATDVARKLYLPPATAAVILVKLAERGLLGRGSLESRYRYQPESPELAGLVEDVVKLDRERPVTLINMVYHPPANIQAFADAFKLKREKEN